MMSKVKDIIKGMAGIMNSVLSGVAVGMNYSHIVICNGGGVVIEEALY